MPREPAKHTLHESGVKGWGAARAILERCKAEDRRELLAGILGRSGVQGAPALDYAARLLRYYADGAEYPVPKKALTPADTRFCQQRTLEVLEPYQDDPRLKPGRAWLATQDHGKAA